jgi:signal transduction histidine kinase/ActR/RegA family two-component response regulator
MNSIPETPLQPRFGLKRQAITASIVLTIGLAGATALAYFWQWQLATATRQAVDVDVPQSTLGYEIALHASQCCRWAEEWERGFTSVQECGQALESWQAAYQKLRDSIERITASETSKSGLEELARWRQQTQQHHDVFLGVVGRAASGELDTPDAVRDALAGNNAIMERISREAETRGTTHDAACTASGSRLEELIELSTHYVTARTIVAFLVLAMGALWVSRSVLTRIAVLSAAIRRFTSGSHGTRIACNANDELGVLGRQFNEMASTIQMDQEQLKRARDSAQAENRSKSEFLAALSEELGRPLKMIFDYSETLLGSIEDPDNRQAVETMRQRSEYLLEVVNSLLDLSKIELGGLQIGSRICSPCQVVAEVCSVMRLRAEGKGLELDVQYAGSIPDSLLTDPVRLRQILLHLIDDAIRAAQSGSVRVMVRFCAGTAPSLQFQVSGTAGAAGGRHRVSALLPRADYGYRAQNLGLAVGRRLTHLLGGTVIVEGETDFGATVTMTIPVQVPADVQMIECPGESVLMHEQVIKKTQPPLKLDCHILLAEDGPENQRLISFILKRAGAEVTVVDNGRQALDRVLAGCRGAESHATPPFDAILMDIDMPLMDGCEAAQRLRQAGYKGLIIAVTGHAQRYDRERCLISGFDDYVAKPLDRSTLLKTLARHSVRLGETADVPV